MTSDRKNLQFNTDSIRDLLSPYLDNEVSPEERRQVEQALAASAELRQELESLRQTVAMLAALPPMPAPRPFTLTEAQVRPAAPARKGILGLPWWVQGWAALAATLVCVLALGTVFWSMQSRTTLPAAEVANAPEITAPATAREAAAGAVAPAESAAQKPAASPTQVSLEGYTAEDEAATEAQPAAAESAPATEAMMAAQAEIAATEAVNVTATPTAGEVTTLAESSQPVPPPAAAQDAATQNLAAAPPAPTLVPPAPAMKEAAEAESANGVGGAAPAEIPPSAEVQSFAAPAQEAAPMAAETGEVEAKAGPATAPLMPATATPTPLPSPTPVAMLTLPAPSPTFTSPPPTATALSSPGHLPENNSWPIVAGALVLVVLAVVAAVWLGRKRSSR